MTISAFDTLGPIMVGPSSSHTAGAAKIGLVAHKIVGSEIKKVTFYLHGSFAKTYKGHGSDKALLAGVIGMNEKDRRIKNAYTIADEMNIDYTFIPKDLGDVHPNTVLIELEDVEHQHYSIRGSSVGGGAIQINQLNDIDVLFSGNHPTIITYHKDVPGVVSKATGILAMNGLNISNMSVIRKEDTEYASMIIEVDHPFEASIEHTLIEKIPAIEHVYLF